MEVLNAKGMVLKESVNSTVEQTEGNGWVNVGGLFFVTAFIAATLLIAGKYALGIRDGEKRNGKIYINNETNPALGNEDRPIHHFVPNDPTLTRVR